MEKLIIRGVVLCEIYWTREDFKGSPTDWKEFKDTILKHPEFKKQVVMDNLQDFLGEPEIGQTLLLAEPVIE